MMGKVKLGDIECFISDGNYSSKYPRNDEFVKEGIPFIRCNNFKNNTITKEDMYYITKEKHSVLLKGHVKEGDILITTRGSLGQIAIVPKEYEDANINAQIVLLRVNKEKVYNRYLLWQLKSQSVQNQIAKNKIGTALQQLPISRLKKIEFFIEEDVKKQLKIADKLDKVQEIIDLRKKQIEELDELIKSMFVEMFGNPKSNNKNWIKAPMGEYMTVLTDFSSNGSYKTLDSTVVMYDEPNYAYMVRTTDLENEDYKNNVKYITEEVYNFLAKSKVYPNDIIMNKIGSAGKVYLMPDVGMPVSLGRNAFLFRYNDDVVPLFIYYLLKSEYGTNEISQYVRGAVTKTITKDDVRKVKIIIPPIELQNQFAELVKQIEKQKIIIEKSLKETEELQESLMNKYFS